MSHIVEAEVDTLCKVIRSECKDRPEEVTQCIDYLQPTTGCLNGFKCFCHGNVWHPAGTDGKQAIGSVLYL